MTPFLAGPAAKVGAVFCTLLCCNLRAPVRISPSAAVLEAREHAAARRVHALPSAGCGQAWGEGAAAVIVPFPEFSADLTELDRNALDTVAARLACTPHLTLLIVSEGDPHRLKAYRREIADLRAEVIAMHLRDRGALPTRIARGSAADASLTRPDDILLLEAVGRPR